jgi:hypothetical protein
VGRPPQRVDAVSLRSTPLQRKNSEHTHGKSPAASDTVANMEWMLQVADEIDDLVGSLMHCWIGARRGIATLLSGLAGAAMLTASVSVGLGPILYCGAALLASAATAFALRRRFAEIR